MCTVQKGTPSSRNNISSLGHFCRAAAFSLKILPLVDSFADKDIDRLVFDKGDSGEKMGECLV